jgi:hypothetical protein
MALFSSNKPEETYTVSGFIEANSGSDEMTYYNFSILQQEVIGKDTFQFTVSNIVDDYMEELKEYALLVQLSDLEKLKYHYNPELLAYDLYGSINLDFVILKLNGIIDPKDFDLPIIKVLNADTLKSLLSTIYNAEQDYIKNNRDDEGITMA